MSDDWNRAGSWVNEFAEGLGGVSFSDTFVDGAVPTFYESLSIGPDGAIYHNSVVLEPRIDLQAGDEVSVSRVPVGDGFTVRVRRDGEEIVTRHRPGPVAS